MEIYNQNQDIAVFTYDQLVFDCGDNISCIEGAATGLNQSLQEAFQQYRCCVTGCAGIA